VTGPGRTSGRIFASWGREPLLLYAYIGALRTPHGLERVDMRTPSGARLKLKVFGEGPNPPWLGDDLHGRFGNQTGLFRARSPVP
jgi:hypothetical protein